MKAQLTKLHSCHKSTQESIEAQSKLIAERIKQREDLEATLLFTEQKIKAVSETITIETAITVDILGYRNLIKSLSKDAEKDTITIAEKKRIDDALREAINEFQRHCPHPLILSYDGYEGSYSNDYDDARYGSRFCTLCHFRENSKSTKIDKYDTLKDNDSRLIKRDIRDKEFIRQSDWIPIPYLVEVFKRSAGDINAHWPVMEKGKMTAESNRFKS